MELVYYFACHFFLQTRDQQQVVVKSGGGRLPGNVDEVEEYVQQVPGGEERLRKWKHHEQHVRETSRGVEHVNVQEARVIQTSVVSSALMSGQLPLPLSFSDAVKHELLDTQTGACFE